MTDTMEAAEATCARLDRKLDRLMRRHKPEDIDEDLCNMYGGMQKEISEVDETCDQLVELERRWEGTGC